MADTYDRVSGIVGITDEKGDALLPPNHMMSKSDLCVCINIDGRFRDAQKDTIVTIVIPCTEDSSTRAGKVEFPHPLHEQIGYLLMNATKREKYLEQLAQWSAFHPKVAAVQKYIEGGTLADDLQQAGIQPEEKMFVRFSVEAGADDKTPNLWEDAGVSQAWQDYCANAQNGVKTLCYVTGETSPIKTKHPKGINPSANGAKLISCNDETNYTYRGRFTEKTQAYAISEQASHKAHAMLKYLIATQGYKCGTQAVVAWSIEDGKAQADPFASTFALLGLYEEDEVKSESGKLLQAQGEFASDYARRFRNALLGKGYEISGMARRVAVIAVDAATTGRMAVTFYQEMDEREYVERILSWHESCRWWFHSDGREFLSSPSTNRIIAAVYGELRSSDYEKQQRQTREKIQKQARERMLHNIFCGEQINRSWVTAVVNRASNPFSYTKDGTWDREWWENAVNVACALVRTYYANKKEEFEVGIETTCNDRSYLFGRLLAVADKLESHARYLQVGKSDTRPTNAVRYMTMFTSKPLRTWMLIYKQLDPYRQQLNGAEGYQSQIDEITSLFIPAEFSDQPLNGKYLLGYSLQRRVYKKEDVSK